MLSPGDDVRLTPNAVLVVAGPEGEIDSLTREVAGAAGTGLRTPRGGSHSEVVVAGLGEGGAAAVEALEAGTSVTTVDRGADSGADVVGEVTEPATLREAGIEDATALVVTVDDDATALLTVAMARALSADVEILARVTEAEKTSAAFRAGADYVLSVQRVCARLVAAEVHGERVMDPVGQIRLVRADGAPFAGETLGEARRAGDRGWTVVGLARDGAVHTDGATVVEAGDEVFVAGGDDAIGSFDRIGERS
ncbi:MAG: TrkA family potassium uptake protein [Haloarculaceae archaeon]